MTSNNELHQDSRTNVASTGNTALVLGHRYEDSSVTTQLLFFPRGFVVLMCIRHLYHDSVCKLRPASE